MGRVAGQPNYEKSEKHERGRNRAAGIIPFAKCAKVAKTRRCRKMREAKQWLTRHYHVQALNSRGSPGGFALLWGLSSYGVRFSVFFLLLSSVFLAVIVWMQFEIGTSAADNFWPVVATFYPCPPAVVHLLLLALFSSGSNL